MDFASFSTWINAAIFAAAAVIVWTAGTKLARYADAIAETTSIGREFLGCVAGWRDAIRSGRRARHRR